MYYSFHDLWTGTGRFSAVNYLFINVFHSKTYQNLMLFECLTSNEQYFSFSLLRPLVISYAIL